MDMLKVQEAVEDHFNRLWEEQNDVPDESELEEKLDDIIAELYLAKDNIMQAIANLNNSMDLIERHPVVFRIESDAEDLKSYLPDIDRIIERLQEEER